MINEPDHVICFSQLHGLFTTTCGKQLVVDKPIAWFVYYKVQVLVHYVEILYSLVPPNVQVSD